MRGDGDADNIEEASPDTYYNDGVDGGTTDISVTAPAAQSDVVLVSSTDILTAVSDDDAPDEGSIDANLEGMNNSNNMLEGDDEDTFESGDDVVLMKYYDSFNNSTEETDTLDAMASERLEFDSDIPLTTTGSTALPSPSYAAADVFFPLRSVDDAPPSLPSSKLFIAVSTSSEYIHTLTSIAAQTWVADVTYPVVYFMEDRVDLVSKSPLYPLVQLQGVEDTSSQHIDKVFAKVEYVWKNFAASFEWFLFLDTDTYVNVEKIEPVLEALSRSNSSSGYVGSMKSDSSLGVKGPYCLGMGYFISRDVLNKLGPMLHECRVNVATLHSDAEIGRCIAMAADAFCTPSPIDGSIKQRLYEIVDGKVNSLLNGTALNPLRGPPPTPYLEALLLHPLKTGEEMYRIHQTTTKYLHPAIPKLSKYQNRKTKRYIEARKDFDASCVSNSAIQQSVMRQENKPLRECPPPAVEEPIGSLEEFTIPTYVLNLEGKEENYRRTQWAYNLVGWNVTRFEATKGCPTSIIIDNSTSSIPQNLTCGELGYRDSMRRIVRESMSLDHSKIIVLDDDTFPILNFKEKLYDLVSDDVCGNHLQTKNRGGVVLLGATIYSKGSYPKFVENDYYSGWSQIDAEVKAMKAGGKANPLCYNVIERAFGSFGTVFHRSSYPSVLEWLDLFPQKPFDHIWPWLAVQGYITKIASPNLVVPDTSKPSSVDPNRSTISMDDRNKMHRWKMERYTGFWSDFVDI